MFTMEESFYIKKLGRGRFLEQIVCTDYSKNVYSYVSNLRDPWKMQIFFPLDVSTVVLKVLKTLKALQQQYRQYFRLTPSSTKIWHLYICI